MSSSEFFVFFHKKLSPKNLSNGRGVGMRDELLAYLLNDLDDEQRQRVEDRLEADPIWQHELERLSNYINAAQTESTDQADASETESLPEDLVSRTCSFVREASAQGELSPAVLPARLSESRDAAAPRKNRWTLLDLAVVASILAVIGSLIAPAIQESRESARRAQCQEQLRTLGLALNRFAEQHNRRLPAIGQHENAGMYAVKLLESGLISPDELRESLVCPSDSLAEEMRNDQEQLHVPTPKQLQQATQSELHFMVKRMGGSFAYRIGYFDRRGNYRQVKFTGSSSQPMMADRPSYEMVGFQSPNHGTCGQNVLFQDGSVRYVQICIQTGPDRHWFLNEQDKHAAGMHQSDIVMGRSEASPSGTITLIDNKRPSVIRSQP